MVTRICVIGNFSGRNAGDAAILGGLLREVSSRYPECEFVIPTINTQFVANAYSEYNVKPVGLLPWNLSIKILGLPIFRSVLSADFVLVTDAILFDYKLLNPLYNYLSTLALVLPLAKKKRIPVVLYNVSLGPVYSSLGSVCIKRVLDSAEIILLRDRESLKLLDSLKLTHYSDIIVESADCALNAIPGDSNRLKEIIEKEGILIGDRPWISFNISSYIDIYVRGYKGKGIGKENFLNLIAEVVDRLIEVLTLNIVLVITQPMDLTIAGQMLEMVKNKEHIKMISNRDYSYQDLTAVFSAVEMHIGMRTHSLILASSVLTPVVGIIATPKNRGYMTSIEQDDKMVEFKDMTVDSLFGAAKATWEDRKIIKRELGPIIEREKRKASNAADIIRKYIK